MKFESGDERIKKKTNEILASLYPVILILTVLAAILKFTLLTQNMEDYILELIAVVGSLSYLVIRTKIIGISLFKNSDECIQEIQNSYLAHSFEICCFSYILGEAILMFLFNKFTIGACYIFIWLIPASIFTAKVIKKGLYIWGSKKAAQKGTKLLKRNVIIGSLCFGILMGWKDLFKNHVFQIAGLLKICSMALIWGILFYAVTRLLMDKSEKYADEMEDKINEE